MSAALSVVAGTHIPVLRDAVIAALAIQPDGSYLDGTFGRGGHAQEILQQLSGSGQLLVMDKDPAAIDVARTMFADDARVQIYHGSFADMADWPATAAGINGVFLDLGVSSPQLDQAERGFSFMKDGPLDMRMNPDRGSSASAWLAVADEREIATVLWTYGEEKASRRIARAIVAAREQAPITTTLALVDVIVDAIGRGVPGKHAATRSFQAIRMQVNRELPDLERGLEASAKVLKPGGRLVVISFHSLEDRQVKRFMRGDDVQAPVRRNLPPAPIIAKRWRVLQTPQLADAAESARNRRARSAVLRVAERLS